MDVQGNECCGCGKVKPMRVVFRVDASLEMGSGHVMRCLTLAHALTERGSVCEFLCREHPGNLIGFIRNQGFAVLSLGAPCADISAYSSAHYLQWLGATQESDALTCERALGDHQYDWMIVDHYGIDYRWQELLGSHYSRLAVIDDLATRSHCCDVLLDQTYGRPESDYQRLVPEGCEILTGSEYALLRPDFSRLREMSLERRKNSGLKRILISLGGVDSNNVTERVLDGLCESPLPKDSEIVVVMGTTAPWLEAVRQRAAGMPWRTSVIENVSDMASQMCAADLAIGAAGSTSWERCCLGLPTLMLILADNQRYAASLLSSAGAAHVLSSEEALGDQLSQCIERALSDPGFLNNMTTASSGITDGAGANRVSSILKRLAGMEMAQ
ncbi:UDP-2,4-diacetamido-2,4,6-trideoxy-beta-L-altropyranose hydrolase [Pseudomonas folii]|nr:UDP-2,4-diacetamido-2,4,6-trideoxy-beta-L-altropyranose hydrolase [Pseudomonas folii]